MKSEEINENTEKILFVSGDTPNYLPDSQPKLFPRSIEDVRDEGYWNFKLTG